MSDTATALNGASFAGPHATIAEMPLPGMVTLRADLDDPQVAGAVQRALGCPLPDRRRIVWAGEYSVAWMSPDELLLLVPHDRSEAVVAELGAALAGLHHLAVDVSDARALFRVDGTAARDVLARLCPADLLPAAFGPGEMRRTRLGQIAAAFWMREDGAILVLCFRSVAQYAFDLLSDAAASGPTGVFGD
ncbi:sarcosine oxidase subunit gamma [Tropicimonas sp.]|uniref:sarcosine oxidase subunit gamma n=1 Tax=Tropicimonas sp. TaxID=2067044 RepID=UPI003A8C309B